MQIIADRPEAPSAIRSDLGAIFISELSRSTWLITSLSPGGGEKMSKHSVPAGDICVLLARFSERRRWLWPLSRARRRSPNSPNNSMSIRTRSRPGDRSFLKGLPGSLVARRNPISSPPAIDVKTLHAKIGELTLERDLYERSPVKRYQVISLSINDLRILGMGSQMSRRAELRA